MRENRPGDPILGLSVDDPADLTDADEKPFQENKRAHELLANAIYYGGLPLSVFDKNPFFDQFCALYNCEVPRRVALATTMLDSAYDTLQTTLTKDVLERTSRLSFTIDETTNIRGHRVINIAVVTPDGLSLHWSTFDVGSRTLSAEELEKILVPKILQISKTKEAVNAYITDTCSLMRKLWGVLRPTFLKTFFVPCDAHGLQLIIKDVLYLPRIEDVFKDAQNIAMAFKTSPKQHAILREIQHTEFGSERAIVSSVITRWGTQVSH